MRNVAKTLAGMMACLLMTLPTLARAEAEILPPRSDWTVDYAADSCALQRDFGAGDDVVHLEFRQFGPGMAYQTLIASPDYALRAVQVIPLIQFSSDTAPHVPISYFKVAYPGRVRGIMFDETLRPGDDQFRYNRFDPAWNPERLGEQERNITWISVKDAFRRELRLATGPLHAPMEALRTCMDELLGHWGIDAAAHRQLMRPVVPENMEVWAQEIRAVYPREKLVARQDARLRLRLDVSPEGRVTGCHLQHLLGDEGFEATACPLLIDNARFLPALDSSGHPVASFHIMTIQYAT